MTRSTGARDVAVATDRFYIDTKGAADSDFDRPNGACHNIQRGTSLQDGSPSLLATGGRSAYARVADKSSLPPEVEQLRPDCVMSATSACNVPRANDRLAYVDAVDSQQVGAGSMRLRYTNLRLLTPTMGTPLTAVTS